MHNYTVYFFVSCSCIQDTANTIKSEQSRVVCVKCQMNRELSFGRKVFLRYMIRIQLCYILDNYIYYTSYVELEYLQRRYFFMNILIKSFTDSAKEFRNLKSVVTAKITCCSPHSYGGIFINYRNPVT